MPAPLVKDLLLVHKNVEMIKAEEMEKASKKK